MKLPDYFDFKDIELVRIQDSDIHKTVALINHAYLYQQVAKGEPRVTSLRLRQYAKDKEFYVAWQHNTIVGCIYLEPNGDSLYFGLLTVIDNQKGTGLAPAILKAIESYAHAKNFKNIGLAYVSVAPWLKKYYQGYGYTESEEVTDLGRLLLIWMHKYV